MFQKGRVRFDIGIIIFFGGLFGYELLQLFITTVQGFWQLLLFVSPLYVALGWGGCGYVFPEYWRLEDGSENSPSLWKLRNVMRLGFVLFAVSSFAFAGGYSIPRQILGQRFAYPTAVVLTLRGIFVVGLSIMGITAIVSKRMEYYGWRRRPATPWSVRKILGVSSLIMIVGGAIILQAFALPAIILLGAGGTTFMIARSLGSGRSYEKKNGGLPASVKLETGPVSFEKRLVIANKVSDLIVQKHGKKILAVCIWGPSAREADPSAHCLDLVAVTRASEKYIPDQHFVYDGIEVALVYWFESSFLWKAKQFGEDWPFYRYEYSTLRVLYERDSWTRHLKSALDESDKADATEAIRDGSMKLVRYIGILTDYLEKRDTREIRISCYEIVDASGDLLLLLNRRFYQTSEYWNEIFKCPTQPTDFMNLVDLAGGFVPVNEKDMVEAALKLGYEMLEMVRLRGIAIESPEPRV